MTPAFPIDEAVVVLPGHRDDSKIERPLRPIEQHIRGEAGALVQDERLADVSDPTVSLVMQLILEEQRRPYATRSTGLVRRTRCHRRPTEALAPELARLASALRELTARERSIDGGLDSALLEMRRSTARSTPACRSSCNAVWRVPRTREVWWPGC
jgi:hypothetical protein